jgi:hypothetical protein
MKLQLLCLTMPTRKDFLARLLSCVQPQITDNQQVGLLIRMCDPQYTLGENRDMLRRSSTAEFIAFVDDDDKISENYVSRILPLLDRDYVGFDLQCYIDGKPLEKLTHHSLQYGGWYENDEAYFRDISHVNPVRRELALLVPMRGGHGEDQRWADEMRARGVLKTERYPPGVFYHYYFRTRKNIGAPCPKCGSESTVLVEIGTHCNGCSNLFAEHPIQKSCLWV